MFGYVTINQDALAKDQVERYRTFYCGLCQQLGETHGLRGRITLSYDLTFLDLLLTALYEPECTQTSARCVPHPFQAHTRTLSPFGKYAADMSVVLAFHNAQDDWADDEKYSSLLFSRMLEKSYLRISEEYPRQCIAISHCLQQLARCEQQNCADLDEVASHFGLMMAELFDIYKDEWSTPLRELGEGLGKFIYLMDAYEDCKKDIENGNYNPLISMKDAPDYEALCHELLTQTIAQCARGFEHLPILQDADILRNIIYSGVWTRYQQLQPKSSERSAT